MPFPGLESRALLVQEGVAAVDRHHRRLARKRVIQDPQDDVRWNAELG
jgi:hypothetical protein